MWSRGDRFAQGLWDMTGQLYFLRRNPETLGRGSTESQGQDGKNPALSLDSLVCLWVLLGDRATKASS